MAANSGMRRVRAAYTAVAAHPDVQFWLPIVVLAGLALPFYWLSAVPYVNGGDKGEFQTLGYLGGIPHPPSYPLLTTALFVGSHALGFLEPAHAANVVNGTFAALATVMLFVVARDVTGSWVAALAAAVVFGTGFRVWTLGVQAEPFSLQMALMLGVAAALRAFQRRPSPARLAVVALATGLSFTNHALSLFMLPFTVTYVLARWPWRLPRPREAALSAGAFLVGLTPWLYLVRARWTPVAFREPETERMLGFRDIWDHAFSFTAAPGGTSITGALFVDPGEYLGPRWREFTQDVLREFGWIWVVAIIVGVFVVAARDWRLAGWTLGTAVLTGLFTFIYTIPDYDRYFAMVYVILGIWLAGGLALLLAAVPTALRRLRFSRFVRPAVCVVAIALLAGVSARAGVQMGGDAWRNISGVTGHAKVLSEHAQAQIRHMVPNSVYMSTWPSSWHHRYALFVDEFGADKNIRVQVAGLRTMGIDQAEEILLSGRSLYLQASTPEYEREFAVVKEGAFFQVFIAADVRDGDLIRGDDDRIYLVSGGERRWIPNLEIFTAHGFAWNRVRKLDDRDIERLPEGTPLTMPEERTPPKPEFQCPPTCVIQN
jgi:hypothetical protein